MIHVAYRLWSGDGFFAKMTGTSMISMFENTKKKVTVHIMHNDRLTDDSRKKFQEIAKRYNQRVEFKNVEEIAESTLKKFNEAYPIPSGTNAPWYLFITPEIFPDLDKLIFLGSDKLVNLDVAELWAYNPNENGCGFGAVPELKAPETRFPLCNDNLVKHENYFNSAVMLVNPKFFKENFETILDGCKFVSEKKYPFAEQDVLNYLFSEKYLKLPYRFNEILIDMRATDPEPYHLEKAIYNFIGAKPDLNTDDVFNRLYLEYFLKTPWATVDMFGNMEKAFNNMFRHYLNESKNTLLHMTNLLNKRRRIFFVEKEFIEPVKQIFEIRDDEPVMDLSTPLEVLAQNLNAARGEAVLFVFVKDYLMLLNFLRSQNFVEDTDFVNAFMFLSERHGFKFNFDTKAILQEM